MDKTGVRDVLKELCGPNVRIEPHKPWLNVSCPFAPWTHRNGTDRSPSFGITYGDNIESIFHCFTCKEYGSVADLYEKLGDLRGEDYSDRIDDIATAEMLGPLIPSWDSCGKRADSQEPIEILSEEFTVIYEHATDVNVSRRYLKKRGILKRTARKLGLLYDPDDGHGEKRLLFPVRHPGGGLLGFTGRALKPGIEPRIRDYLGLPKRSCLLGVHDLPSDSPADRRRPIVLVEGLFDYAKAKQAGVYAVASMHAGLSRDQVRLLRSAARPVVVMYDNDEAGHIGKGKVAEALASFVPVLEARYPDPYDEDLDPGSLDEDVIRSMVENARLL